MEDLRRKFTNERLSEWEEKMPNELERDAIGLWQIIPALKYDFGLTGEKLILHVKKNVARLIELGARPVTGAPQDDERYWIVLDNYGKSPNEVAERIVEDWINSGKDPDFGDVWFARKSIYELTNN